MASRIVINGVAYTGSNVTITNGVVQVDGVVQGGKHLETKICEIRILEGVLGELKTDASVTCLDVAGGVRAGGSVACRDVGKNVDAGGSVTCGNVGGDVDAGGSVHRN